MNPKLLFFFLCLAIAFGVSGSLVLAQHFVSNSYIIDWGNFNITSGHKYSTNYQLSDTVGQNAAGISSNTGISVQAGFQYIYDTFNKLSFSIDNLNINFGTLTPNTITNSQNLLTITTPSGRGYQLMAQENHPLWIDSSNYIPDTTCDNNDCSISSSTLWINDAKYGFGFNISGIGTSSYFSDSQHFRPFAATSNNQGSQIIASENTAVKNRQLTVNYQVIISPQQTAGDYQTFITYTLVPIY
jgi:hypothetical protein